MMTISQEWRPSQRWHKKRLHFAIGLQDTIAKASAVLGDRIGCLLVLCAAIRMTEDGYTVVLEIRWRTGGFGDFEISATDTTFDACIGQLKNPQVIVDAVLRQQSLESERDADGCPGGGRAGAISMRCKLISQNAI
ncbi:MULTISPECIES: hypothetical protein [Mesorhizobium]|uniref:hypothetical protein n=1 Tax=Mesorhizobium sp. TaxID=1871066 RepID=UPI000493D21B|nr:MULTISPECIES: hypothetical protein [Mesorhizobium]RWM68515.1 MAG: hypothetical protein EOR82_24920 [Mesorhizobium sp.]TIO22229.1 MAG: hypothetical protein E5X83_26125 [Mesorhizobium sp.]TJV55841.1 MAG: hypothetical protein E5X82_25640 [Mesorhizobium sp.]